MAPIRITKASTANQHELACGNVGEAARNIQSR
jgi:hypothetical protein